MFTLTTADRALFEDGTLSLEGLQAARERRDPRLAEYLVKLAILDPAPHGMLEAAEQSRPSYLGLLADQQSWEWKKRIQAKDPTIPGQSGYSRQKRQAVIGHQHRESWAPIEQTPEILPDRVKTSPLVEELWTEGGAYTRNALLQIIEHAPLKWGPWRALKRLFKLSIVQQDWEVFAALTVRFDLESQKPDGPRSSILRIPLVRVRPRGSDKDELHQVQAFPEPSTAGSSTAGSSTTEPQKIPTTPFHWGGGRGVVRDVQSRTLEYLLRRAWRTLRQLAKAQPDAYAFVAAEILSRYPAGARISEVLEPIFTYDPELWARSIAPLMNIVERAANERSLDFAFILLESRFREQLKTADPEWILRLARSPRRVARRLAVRWFLEPLSGTEQGRLHEIGLHRAVLAFLDYDDEQKKSGQDEPWNDPAERGWLQTWYNGPIPKGGWPQLARQYALDYIKGSADVISRDLPLEKVMWLLRSREPGYRELGEYLLQPSEGPSPYADQLTLAVWTELLEDTTTFTFAARAIRRGFSGAELTADWYAERMLSKHKTVREMALEMLRDETKFRADDDWVGFHKKIARSHDAQPDVLQRSLYQLSRKDEEGRSNLDDLEPEFLRMLLVHPVPGAHLSLIGWIDGGRVPLDKLGVDFLKQLSNADDWEARAWLPALGAERAGLNPSKDGPYETSKYIGTVGAAVRRWLRNASTLEVLGYGWTRERLEKFEANYDWIRELFRRDMPFAQLAPASDPAASSALTPDAPGAAEAGLEAVLKRILRETDAGSPAANFYKRFLLERHALARRDDDPNLPPLPDALQLPRHALTFRWFEKLASDERAPIREFAMQLADYEMQRWTGEEPLDFPRIKPLLRDSFHDVRRYLVQAMTAPRRPEGHLDVDQPQFKVEDLYAWCFDARRDLRDLGMEIILRLPQRFGQPAQLLQLSESNDPRVREMVIAVLWKQFRALEVTGGWQPYARSVVPQSLSLSRAQRVVTLLVPPPEGMKPGEVKATRKYLGTGVPAQVDVRLDDRDLFLDFVRRALFQLPPVRQSPKLPARDYKLKTAWRNKRTLIGAVRDLAMKDSDFATFILPLIQEYQNVRGRMVRDASLAALAHIHAAHPDLGALTPSGSVPPSALASGHAGGPLPAEPSPAASSGSSAASPDTSSDRAET